MAVLICETRRFVTPARADMLGFLLSGFAGLICRFENILQASLGELRVFVRPTGLGSNVSVRQKWCWMLLEEGQDHVWKRR